MQSLIELSRAQLLKSGLEPLARHCTHRKTISGTPEQVYLLSGPRLEWAGEGQLFKSDTNKRQGPNMQPQFKSSRVITEVRPEALGQIWYPPGGRSRRPEQKYLPSDQRLEWPAKGPLFKPAYFHKFQIAYPDR